MVQIKIFSKSGFLYKTISLKKLWWYCFPNPPFCPIPNQTFFGIRFIYQSFKIIRAKYDW